MRTNNIAVSFTMKFPYGKRDHNGICYSREAVLKALSSAKAGTVINAVPNNGQPRVIGMTNGAPYAIQDNEVEQAIQLTIDGTIMFGGTEDLVNRKETDETVTDFEIVAFGISE